MHEVGVVTGIEIFCYVCLSLLPFLWHFTSSLVQKILTITFKTEVAFGFRVDTECKIVLINLRAFALDS